MNTQSARSSQPRERDFVIQQRVTVRLTATAPRHHVVRLREQAIHERIRLRAARGTLRRAVNRAIDNLTTEE